MRYRITVDVDGETVASGDFTLDYNDYSIGVITDDAQAVKKLYIEKKTADTDKPPSIEPGTNGVKFNFTFRSPACREELVEKLIYFEALGAFWWHIRSFNIDEAREEWIPETDEEKQTLSFIAVSQKVSYPQNPTTMHDHQIKALLEMEEDEKAIVMPLTFYREGTNNFKSLKYINAFQKYFLMIEGLFAQGKSGNAAQIKALTSSPELQAATERMLQNVLSDTTSDHFKTLSKELTLLEHTMDSSGVINWLVRTRGLHSHFSVKSTIKQGQPHLQHEFRTHAYIAQGICLFIYTDFHTEVLRKNGYVKN